MGLSKGKTKKSSDAQLKRLKKEALVLHAKAVKMRDDNECLICGTEYQAKGTSLHCHHWYKFKKQSSLLQFELDNGVSLCHGHHTGNYGIHKGPSVYFLNIFMMKIKAKFGDHIEEKLRDFNMSGTKVNRIYLEEKIQELKNYIGE